MAPAYRWLSHVFCQTDATPIQIRRCTPESHHINTEISVGKYSVSPLTNQLADGQYRASVSIRTGRGRATHDRVLRFIPLFATSKAAIDYATAQGLSWVRQAAC